MEKMSTLRLPDNVFNWVSNFLTGRTHSTRFNSHTSELQAVNASVVQGSVIGPVAYAIAASDLKTLTVGNSMNKFADDSYLLIPVDNIDTTNLELDNIEK